MEIKLGGRIFLIPDACPVDAPKQSTLRRNLREHGVEAFMLSHKLGPLAGCVLEELVQAGAEIVTTESGSQVPEAAREVETPVLTAQPDTHDSPTGEAAGTLGDP